jgi:hypothetical protein
MAPLFGLEGIPMKKLIAATLVAFALSTPTISTQAMAFDISTIDGIPSDMKDTIAKQSGGRVTNKQSTQQAGQQGQQQAGQGAQQQQQQGGRQARKKQSTQDKAMQSVDQIMKGDGTVGQAIGSFR